MNTRAELIQSVGGEVAAGVFEFLWWVSHHAIAAEHLNKMVVAGYLSEFEAMFLMSGMIKDEERMREIIRMLRYFGKNPKFDLNNQVLAGLNCPSLVPTLEYPNNQWFRVKVVAKRFMQILEDGKDPELVQMITRRSTS